MSRDSSEHGTVKLPASELARVKKAIRDENNAIFVIVHNYCKVFWTDYAKRSKSVDKHRQAREKFWVQRCGDARLLTRANEGDYMRRTRVSARVDYARGLAHSIVERMAYAGVFRQATLDDLQRFGELAKATNRTTSFKSAGVEISFKDNFVTYNVEWINHGIEAARELPLTQTLLAALGTVKWTKATGGTWWGEDEDTNADGGEDGYRPYITVSFGPIGEAQFQGGLGSYYA